MKGCCLIVLAFTLTLTGCAHQGTGSGYNRILEERDPVTGEMTRVYSLGLDNSTDSFLTAGSRGGEVRIECSAGQLNRVLIDPSGGLANGWLHIRFDNKPPYVIQGTNFYPYDFQLMKHEDAAKFARDVITSDSAVTKVGFSKGYKVMKLHLEDLPRQDLKYSCGLHRMKS